MRQISRILLALTLAGPIAAQAADLDYDFLRGPEYDAPVAVSGIDWSGVYVGGHGGYSSAANTFPNSFSPIVSAAAIRNPWVQFDQTGVGNLMTYNRRRGGEAFGAFAGYNLQFEDIVVGIEADYTNSDIMTVSTDAIKSEPNSVRDGIYTLGISGTKIQDYGTIRARAGYALGNILPFVTGGLAIGRARIFDNVISQSYSYVPQSSATQFGAALPFGISKTKVVGGIALGGGLEYAITPSILLRAEYQYVLFNDFDGHKANLNTVRGGAAVKF